MNDRQNKICFAEFKRQPFLQMIKANGITIEMNEIFVNDFDESPILKSFREIPKDFTIITNTKTYKVLRCVYNEITASISNSNQNEINLKVDNEIIFSYIIDLINGQKVHLTYNDYLLLKVVAKDSGLSSISHCFQRQREEISRDFIISQQSLITFLRNQPKDFTIITKRKQYKCNKISAAVSQKVMNSIKNDQNINSYYYDFEDENNEFQIIHDYLEFKAIFITPENIEILDKISHDLEFDILIKIIEKIKTQQILYDEIINEYEDEIDDIDELFQVLSTKSENESVFYITKSKWLENYELQKELIGSFLSLVYSSPKMLIKIAKIISMLFDRIKSIQKAENKFKNIDLRKLKHFIIRRSLKENFDFNIGPFIYELIKLNFIKLPKIQKIKNEQKKLIDDDDDDDLNKEENDEDDSDLLVRCINDQFTALWILPELDEIVRSLPNFIEKIEADYSISDFLSIEYRENDWKNLREIRENRKSPSQIAISLSKDDVDQFQKLIYLNENGEYHQPLYLSTRIDNRNLKLLGKNRKKNDQPDSLFDKKIPFFEFDLYSDTSYIDYAAFHGSIQCFKYLMLNGAKITCSTFDAAIEGGNFEIVRITEQKLNECHDDSYYNGFVSKSLMSFDSYPGDNNFQHRFHNLILHHNGLERAIYKHNDNIFDWIFENKTIHFSELKNLIQIASLSNNVHAISLIFSRYPYLVDIQSYNSIFHSILNAASLGFSLCVKILLKLFGVDYFKKFSLYVPKGILNILYVFDNVEIFQMTWNDKIDFQLFIDLCCHNSISLFKHYYQKVANKKVSEYLINFAIMYNSEEIFEFLLNQIVLNNSNEQQEIFNKKLIMNTVRLNCLPILKFILKSRKNKFQRQIILKCLIISAKNGYENIFEYLTNLYFSTEKEDNEFINEITKNLFSIFQSGSLKIIKSIINLIDNENYIKTIMFDSLVKESEKILLDVKPRFNPNNVKTIFLIKNVTEFLISYADKVIPEFLIAATKVNNLEAVKAIVAKNSSYNFINSIFPSNGNALTVACQNKYNEIVKYLLKNCPEIDPSLGVPFGNNAISTPLKFAIQSQNLEIVKAIIDLYKIKDDKSNLTLNKTVTVNPHAKEIEDAISSIFERNKTFLSEITSQFGEMISYLTTIDGVNVNEIQVANCPLLYILVNDELIGTLNLVLSLPNVNPNVFESSEKETPLIKSIREKQNKATLSLLSHKDIDVNFEAYNHITALCAAVIKNDIQIAELLIKNPKLDVSGINYSICLYKAIELNQIDMVNLILSRKECNVNVEIPYLYKSNYIEKSSESIHLRLNANINNNFNVHLNQNHIQDYINLNIKILEKESKFHSVSIIKAATASKNIEIVKSVVNHPSFIADEYFIIPALFESVKIGDSEIFDLLMSFYKSGNIHELKDLNYNSIIVIASASNNLDFINLISENVNKKPSSFYTNQLAFIVAPSVEMMSLIIRTLPGVALSLPLNNGSNYLTALVDFCYEIFGNNDLVEQNQNNQLLTRENFIMDKVEFILSNSNLKLTSKDLNGHTFLSKITSRMKCFNFLTMTSFIYSRITPSNENIKSSLIDEETLMNPLHLICNNLPNFKFTLINIKENYFNCEDNFDFIVNHFIIKNDLNMKFTKEKVQISSLFQDNSKLFGNQTPNFIDDHINSVDILNQTPIIKAVLNLNFLFARFLLFSCNADVDVVDVFGNDLLDYLIMLVNRVYSNFQITDRLNSIDFNEIKKRSKSIKKVNDDINKDENKSDEKSDEKNKNTILSNREICSIILNDFENYFLNESHDLDTTLIVGAFIEFSAFLDPQKSLDK